MEDILINIQDLNLKVEQKDVDNLLEIYVQELFTGEIKYFFHEKREKRK